MVEDRIVKKKNTADGNDNQRLLKLPRLKSKSPIIFWT